jgi:hypothetical protein
MRMSLARLAGGALLAALSMGGGACLSPSTFLPTDGGSDPGTGGGSAGEAGGLGGASGGGVGGMTASRGTGGHAATGSGGGSGLGGTPGLGGRTGTAGTTGTGGTVIGPTASLMDAFEAGAGLWLAPQSSDSVACGQWAVVADGATNHVYQQSLTSCSNPSWAAGGSVDWTDMRLQVRVRFPAGTTTSTKVTLGVRYNGPKDVYFIEYSNDGKIKIRSRTAAGSTTDVVSDTSSTRVPIADGQWATVGLAVSGSTVSAYLGADRAAPPILTGTTTGQVKGGVAFGASGGAVAFDDILVTPP